MIDGRIFIWKKKFYLEEKILFGRKIFIWSDGRKKNFFWTKEKFFGRKKNFLDGKFYNQYDTQGYK